MRALQMDFANDTAVKNIGNQYMFGPAILVNPVTDFLARNRAVYLPTGTGWYNLYDGKFTAGGQTITADAPYEQIPLFVKEGSIIPYGPEIEYTAEKNADPIILYVYGGKDASFTLYEDENTNYNYENGQFATIQINYTEATKTVSIENRKGSFKGMLNNRTFKIILVTKDKPLPLDLPNIAAQKIVKYSGKKMSAVFQNNKIIINN
ncbi:hypothetical protein BH11BAC5_BH11BAC5_20690 [soil metagenome]